MTTILPRSFWTTTKNGRAGRDLDPSRVTALTFHYPGQRGFIGVLTDAQLAARLRGYRAGHLGRGWADIGYNYAVDQAGRIVTLTGLTVGAHAGGTGAGNVTSVGVLLVLGNTENPTPAMIDAVRALRAVVLERMPRATAVRPHSYWTSTGCPGDKLRALIKDGTFTRPPAATVKPRRWFKVALVNYGASTAALSRPAALVSWTRRRGPLTGLVDSIAADVVGALECGARGPLTWITDAHEKAGRRLVPGGKGGRHLFIRDDWTVRASGVIDPPRYRDNDDKPAPWVLAELDGTLGMVVLSHLETARDADVLRIRQQAHIISEARKVAAGYGVGASRIVFLSDTASDALVRDRAFEPAGYRDAHDVALRAENTAIKSYNEYADPRPGPRVDLIAVHERRPVLVVNQRITLASDHHVQAAIIGRQTA